MEAAAAAFTRRTDLEDINLWSNLENYEAYLIARNITAREVEAMDFEALHNVAQTVDTSLIGFADTYEELAEQFAGDHDGARFPTEDNLITANGVWFHR